MADKSEDREFCVKNGLWHAVQFDKEALSHEQIERLREHIEFEKKTDEEYLRDHSEIPAIINFLFRRIEQARPDDLMAFCLQLFSQPLEKLENELRKETEVLHGEDGTSTIGDENSGCCLSESDYWVDADRSPSPEPSLTKDCDCD